MSSPCYAVRLLVMSQLLDPHGASALARAQCSNFVREQVDDQVRTTVWQCIYLPADWEVK
jgi:hypothetical protein